MKSALLKKIEDRSAVAAVIGLGYVGLPLAMELCEAGFHVIGYDVSERVVALLMRGESHIQDVPAEQVGKHVKSGKFLASTDAKVLSKSDTVSIAVPTPLAKTRDPDMSYVLSAASTIAEQAHPGMLIVLESTTYPGTTRELPHPTPMSPLSAIPATTSGSTACACALTSTPSCTPSAAASAPSAAGVARARHSR